MGGGKGITKIAGRKLLCAHGSYFDLSTGLHVDVLKVQNINMKKTTSQENCDPQSLECNFIDIKNLKELNYTANVSFNETNILHEISVIWLDFVIFNNR